MHGNARMWQLNKRHARPHVLLGKRKVLNAYRQINTYYYGRHSPNGYKLEMLDLVNRQTISNQ